MARTKWGVIYNGDDLTLAMHFASLAQAAGADVLWTAEGWRDAFVPLTAVASAAKEIRVGTTIAQMARPSVLTALSALSMAELTGGKFILGVGTGPRDWNRNWHGFDVPRLIPRIREYIECIRTVLKATPSSPASFSGTFYNVSDYVPFLTAPVTDIPIYVAGVNPRMTELAGSHADGLILGPLRSLSYLKETVHPNLNKGLAKRDGAHCELCLTHICAVNNDAGYARNLARHAIAFYSVLPYYDVVLSPLGFAAQAQAIREAFGRRDFPAIINAVTDDMIAALALAGTTDDVRRQAQQFENMADRVILYAPYFGIGVDETRANHAAMLEVFS